MFSVLENRVKAHDAKIADFPEMKSSIDELKFLVEYFMTRLIGKEEYEAGIQLFRERKGGGRQKRKRFSSEANGEDEEETNPRKRACVVEKQINSKNPTFLDSASLSLDHSVRIENSILVFDYHHGKSAEEIRSNSGQTNNSHNINIDDSEELSPEILNKSSRNTSKSMSFGVQDHLNSSLVGDNADKRNNTGDNLAQIEDSERSGSSSSTNFEGSLGAMRENSRNNELNQVNSSQDPQNTPPDIIAELGNSSELSKRNQDSQGSSNGSKILTRTIPCPSQSKNKRDKNTLSLSILRRSCPKNKKNISVEKLSRTISEETSSEHQVNSPILSSPDQTPNSKEGPRSLLHDSNSKSITIKNTTPENQQPSLTSQENPSQEQCLNIITDYGSSLSKMIHKDVQSDPLPNCSKALVPAITSISGVVNLINNDPPRPLKVSGRRLRKIKKLLKSQRYNKGRLKIAQAFVENDGHENYLTKPKVITIDSSPDETLKAILPPPKRTSVQVPPATATNIRVPTETMN